MIKAVFFDLYQTLITYDPPREELEAQALRDFGIEVEPKALRLPMIMADEFFYQEHSRSPLSKRSKEEIKSLYVQYQTLLLKKAGVQPSPELIGGILAKWQSFNLKRVLFDDVLPILKELKDKGLLLGLISNVDHDIAPLFKELGLNSLLQVIVTSQEVEFPKPHPAIFQEAVNQAQVKPREAIYVGDQYQVDVLGAERAGLKGVLLDRYGYFNEVTDHPRIQSLLELSRHLN